jgi:hypothetical protein
MKLTVYLHLEPKLKIHGAIPPFTHTSSWCDAQLIIHKDIFDSSYQYLTQSGRTLFENLIVAQQVTLPYLTEIRRGKARKGILGWEIGDLGLKGTRKKH